MKHTFIVIWIALVTVVSAWAQNSVPSLITYQGKLVDAGGAALPNGTYSMAFKLYDAATGGTLVWGQTYAAPVTDGVFSVALGATGGTAVPGAAVTDIRFAFGGPNRFLQIEVLSDENGVERLEPLFLLPRQQMGAVPYAVQAKDAANATMAADSQLLAGRSAQWYMPVGTVVAFVGTTAPSGWLLCDGSLVSRTTYPGLFGVIGTSHGSSSSTNFRLPDYRGRFLRGRDGGTGRDPDRGSRTAMNSGGNSGDAIGSVQNHALQSHEHPVRANMRNPGTGFGSSAQGQPTPGTYYGARATAPDTGNISSETRPINAYVNYIIKH